MAQQKQRKQLILTDNKNISTYRFQPMQRLQPNFITDGIRNFMYTKHNGDNAELRIFSFIPQRQRIQPNFMNDSIRTFIHTKQLNTHTQPEQPKQQLVAQIICSYNWDNTNSAVFIFNLRKKLADFVHFIHHQFCTLHRPPKNLYLACWTISYMSSILTWIRYRKFLSSIASPSPYKVALSIFFNAGN